ncbi:MAG TPA: hypothetical protein G4N94_11140 [Caldilineae bacterium]|nr:hypothetical protein [Caldilineae bacterium]
MSSCQIDTARASMAAGITLKFDAGPLRIERMEVHPYPDLRRLWLRVQLSNFATPPNVRLACLDADGNEVADMLLVEWQDAYISMTMHLRQPEPGAEYIMRAEVARDEELLDSRDLPFVLEFQDQ